MTVLAMSAADAPDWCRAEMPPGYQTRLEEIERLSKDIRDIDRLGRLLWATGEPLHDAVRGVFGALRYEVEPGTSADGGHIAVALDGRRRLLLCVSSSEVPIEKQSDEIAQVFQLLQRSTASQDRVLLVADRDRAARPADRSEAVTTDALRFLQRLGANAVRTHGLFYLWRIAGSDAEGAREIVDRLHAQDGGPFAFPWP